MPSSPFFIRILRYLVIIISLGFVCLEVSAQTIKYKYDALGRVRVVEDGVNGNRGYDYDAAGNRINVAGPDFVAPSQPSGLAGSNFTYNSVTISWTASTDNVGVSGYEYSLNGGAWTSLSSSPSVNLLGLTPSTNYTLAVRAKDAWGNYSGVANTSFRTLDDARPTGIPVIGQITSVSGTATWTASVTAGATYEWSINGGASWTATSSTSASISGLSPSTGYTFTVRALHGTAISTPSATSFTTLVVDPPTSLRFSNVGTTSITATWNPSPTPGATYVYSRFAGDAWSSPISTTTVNLTGLTSGSAYNFSVKALVGGKYSNPISLTFMTNVIPTGAPGTPSITSISATAASVSWTASATSSATYEWTTDGWVTTGSNTGFPYGLTWTLTNLTPSRDYTFQVRAVKDNVKSTPSIATFRTADVGLPGTPTFSNVTSTSITASWGASSTSGATYQWTIDGGSSWTAASSTSAAIGGLSPSTGYTFVVRAVLGGLPSAQSSASFTTPARPAPLTMVGSLTIGTPTTTSVTVSWQAATGNPGATSYEYALNGIDSWTSVGNTLSTTVSGLNPGTSYTIAVRPRNASGPSGAIQGNFKTIAIPLAMVGSLSLGPATTTSIAMSWSAATGSPGPDSYEYSRTNSDPWTNVGANRVTTVTGLSPNTSYTFYVRAKNADGTSAAISGTSSTMAVVLAAPTGLKCYENWGPGAWKGQWDAVPGAHHYVFKEINKSEISVSDTSTGSTPMQQSTKPCSWVKACDASNNCGAQTYF
jgi:chitodextrinase